jgi:Na+-translocating ferredoxin:NAD+ oxidoreductase RNF subunit RnfB
LKDREKIRQIYEALPKLNCGLCGFANCGQFARAVIHGKASPFGCKQNPWSGYKISEIIGKEVTAYRYGLQLGLVSKPRVSLSPKVVREEVKRLSQRVDSILASIENLKN